MTTVPPKALLFDLDETLIPESRPLHSAYRAVAEALHGGAVDEAAVQRVRLSARATWEEQAPCPEYRTRVHVGPSDGLSSEFSGDGDERAQLREFGPRFRAHAFDRALPAGFDGDSTALREIWWAARIGTQTVFPGARELLEDLRSHYRLALVTNGTSDFQRHKLEVTDLGRYFEVVIVSGDLGTGKPYPEPFLAAVAALGVGVEAAVMIGNDAARDIAGAQAAGIRHIWMQPGDDPEPGAHTDLTALPALL